MTETTTKDYRDGFWHGARIIRERGLPTLLQQIRNDRPMLRNPRDMIAGMIDAALEQAQRTTIVRG